MSDVPPLPPQAPPPGSRPGPRQPDNTGNVLIAIFGGLALILLLCGGMFFAVYWTAMRGVRQVTTSVTNELNRISAEMQTDDSMQIVMWAEAITDIDVPPELQPKTASRIRIPYSDSTVMSVVVFADEQEVNHLLLAQFNEGVWGKNAFKQMRTQMEQAMREQGHEQEGVEEESREEWVRVIREREATFAMIRGRGKQTDEEKIVLQGVFMGKRGPTFLAAILDAETYSDARARAVIDSIR